MEYVQVDGSRGEGGGQILRTAVAFSAIEGLPVRVDRIRAGRDPPGLKRQHISALQVLARVFGGGLEGATEGSSSVAFVPGRQRLESLSLDMGTAASITLVLQAVVPAVALTGARLKVDLVGGTDVPWSPTYDYFERVVLPAYGRVGIHLEVIARRRGYYPRGGGMVSATVDPCKEVLALDLTKKLASREVELISRCGRLPRHVAERQLESARVELTEAGFRVESSELTDEQSDSPGSSILAFHVDDSAYVGSDGLGARGRPAEEVGKDAAARFISTAKSGACLDPNVADMVLPLLSLAPKGSVVSVPTVTSHLRTGLELASQFTGCRWEVEQNAGIATVTVTPKSGR